jgi:hypothetical protein
MFVVSRFDAMVKKRMTNREGNRHVFNSPACHSKANPATRHASSVTEKLQPKSDAKTDHLAMAIAHVQYRSNKIVRVYTTYR